MNGIADTEDVANGYSGSNEEDYYLNDQYENDQARCPHEEKVDVGE